jgi:sporulation protein YlmC with PRC-barrel domain
MRTIPIAVAALLVLASGTASAQSPASRPAGSPAPSATQAPVQKAPAPNPLTMEDVSRIEGNAVYGGDNEKIGNVSTVLMNPESKQIDRLVVTAGGFLGIGGHPVAIPIERFTWDGDKVVFRLPMTEANLKSMPAWVEGDQTATGSSQPAKDETAPAGAGDSEKPRQ